MRVGVSTRVPWVAGATCVRARPTAKRACASRPVAAIRGGHGGGGTRVVEELHVGRVVLERSTRALVALGVASCLISSVSAIDSAIFARTWSGSKYLGRAKETTPKVCEKCLSSSILNARRGEHACTLGGGGDVCACETNRKTRVCLATRRGDTRWARGWGYACGGGTARGACCVGAKYTGVGRVGRGELSDIKRLRASRASTKQPGRVLHRGHPARPEQWRRGGSGEKPFEHGERGEQKGD